jgi:hypothetical protein
MKGMLKWPLLIAAFVVLARLALERAGAPESVNNIFSVVILYLLICPLYFATRIARSGVPRPYGTLLKTTALYTALARAMVIPTYWLAYIYQWPQPRFSVSQGGVVGPGVSPLNGYVVIPVAAALLWIVGSLIIGGGLGSIVIAVKRRSSKKARETIAAR